MFTSWTIRNWTTCFFACKFPLDEEPDSFCSSSAHVPGATVNRNIHGTNKLLLRNIRSNQERELPPSSAEITDIRSEETEEVDEDYIVFCFRDDGAIRLVEEEEKREASDHFDHRAMKQQSSARPVNRKLIYMEHEGKVFTTSHDSILKENEGDGYPTNEADSVIYNKKGKGKWKLRVDTAFREENPIEETKECKMASGDQSSDSNQSDGSSSSFAFPILSWEGVDSPAQMPKSNALRKHNKARAAHLHCFRF